MRQPASSRPHLELTRLQRLALTGLDPRGAGVPVSVIPEEGDILLRPTSLVEERRGLTKIGRAATHHHEQRREVLPYARVVRRARPNGSGIARLGDNGERLFPCERYFDTGKRIRRPIARPRARQNLLGCVRGKPPAPHRTPRIRAAMQDETRLARSQQIHAKRREHPAGRRAKADIGVSGPSCCDPLMVPLRSGPHVPLFGIGHCDRSGSGAQDIHSGPGIGAP